MNESSNPKRDLILRTGKELFWKYGFRRVTVEEVCKEAGVSKMTYYKYFSNKPDLVKTIMDTVLSSALEKYRQIINSKVPYPEKVIQMIELKREQVKTMSSEFFKDYVQSADPEMINYLNQLSQENLQIFVDDFRKAQENGDIRKDMKIGFIMYIMNQLVEMTHDDQLLAMYDSPEDLVMEIIKFIFYGILNRDVHT